MTFMPHAPESRLRQETTAQDDSHLDPATPPPDAEPVTSDASVDPDGAAHRPHHHRHDPYQPL